MSDQPVPLRPPLSQILIYAIGQLGWSLASYGAANLLVYFYLPPEAGNSPIFPAYIYSGSILGIATLIGLASFGGRIFDAITDPLIANASDRTRSKIGKRKLWLLASAGPFALFSFLIFFPVSESSETINGLWLIVCLFFFYLAMTAYVIPYTALIGELGHMPKDRMRISTIVSVTWALGFLIGSNAYAIQAWLEQTYSSTQAFQFALAGFALLAFICMLIPVFFLKEQKYSKQQPVTLPIRDSLKLVWSNRNFRFFAFSDWFYWIAITFIQLGVGYYVTVLMGLEKEQATAFLTIAFLGSFALYYPVNLGVNRFGKRKILLLGFLIFTLVYLITANCAYLVQGGQLVLYFLALLAAFPMAIFGIIPNALVADLIYEEEQASGEQLSGMFYAARNFIMKLGIASANLLFPSMLLLGKSTEEPTGIILSAWIALVFCVAGYLVFLRYHEPSTRK